MQRCLQSRAKQRKYKEKIEWNTNMRSQKNKNVEKLYKNTCSYTLRWTDLNEESEKVNWNDHRSFNPNP